VQKKRSQRKTGMQQGQLEFPQHGGARKGAGRKPKGRVAGPSHAARPENPAQFPLLVTQRLGAGLPSLRKPAEVEVLRTVFAEAANRAEFRIVHFSVQTNHLHYICEARNKLELTRGMRSLGVKIARRLNRLWKRRGPVFAERFHARALETPAEVRNALSYVLNNARKHGHLGDGVDPYSSGPWFDGWNAGVAPARRRAPCRPIAKGEATWTSPAETWLLRLGWRRRGLIDPREIPGGQAVRRAKAREEASLADLIQRSVRAAALNPRPRSPACVVPIAKQPK
jgi:REP element-mobilizing transposase RayT